MQQSHAAATLYSMSDGDRLAAPQPQGVPWSTTPLIYAAKMGHASMVTLLMERGASVAATYKASKQPV